MTTERHGRGGPVGEDLRLVLVGSAGSAAVERLTAVTEAVARVPDVTGAVEQSGPETDAVVVVHEPPLVDARIVVERLRAARPELPVVALVPEEETPTLPADAATDHVRRTGEWETDLLRRVVRLATVLDAVEADTEAAVSDAVARHEATLDRMTDGFFRLDEAYRFVEIDDHAAETLGLDPATDTGRSIWEVFPDAEGTIWEEQYREAMRTGEPTAFERYVPQLGAWFEVYSYPDADGLSVYFREVTDRKGREAELEAYERLVENVGEMLFVLDGDCRFDIVTEPLAAWLGYDRGDLKGRDAEAVLAEPTFDRLTDRLAAWEPSDDPVVLETEVVTGEEEAATVMVELTPLRHGDGIGRIVGSVHDVTDRRDRERRHDALVDHVPGMVYRRTVEDPTGTAVPLMTFVSDDYEEITGREREPLTAGAVEWLTDVVHPADRDRVAELVRQAVAAREPYTATYRITTPEGTRWVRDRARPITAPDGSVAVLEGLVLDVTDRKRRNRHQQVLTRVIRHDIRNAVQAVLGFATEIRDRAAAGDLTDEDAERMADYVVERGERLGALSEQAREIKSVIGTSADEVGTVDAARCCRRVVGDRRIDHDARLRVTAPETARVRAGAELARAVDELVENAVVHAEDPSVRVAVEDADRDGWVAIRVADDGPGLPEREQAVLSGEREITQLVHGRGLGLWLVKWLVESYGGEVRFATDGGTTVTLLLRRRSA